jgi:hypothetical protein
LDTKRDYRSGLLSRAECAAWRRWNFDIAACIQAEMQGAGKLRGKDVVAAPLCEAALIAIAGVAAWIAHAPLLFASLGPTAYELIETPERRSARPYNVIVGHLIGVLAGLSAAWVTRADAVAAVGVGSVPLARVWAAVIGSAITVLLTLLLRAAQPAAIATTLLIALGMMQGWRSGVEIMAAVLVMTLVGEPLRAWRRRDIGVDEEPLKMLEK